MPHHSSSDLEESDKYLDLVSNKLRKASEKSVSFDADPVTAVHSLERLKEDEKSIFFYKAKDLNEFRIEYITELQELQEKMDRQRSGSKMFLTFMTRFQDALTCKPITNIFCSNFNRN